MLCSLCGQALAPAARFCGSCGRPVAAPAPRFGIDDLIGDFTGSLKEAVLLDKLSGSEILRSPVFRFLAFVAIVPLAIQTLEGNKAILYGLALWSMILWSLLLYRLFADRDLTFRWAIGTVLFTCLIGLPLLEIWLWLPPHITEWAINRAFFPLRLFGYIFGVGLREELCKAIPLVLLALFTSRMKNPVNGLVLGMMSGIGFAGAENFYYVFQTLERALEAMKKTGEAGHLVMPVYNNVVRMAMTPFLHGCFSAICGYFISLALGGGRRLFHFLFIGLALSATLHGLYDTLVGSSVLLGVLVEVVTFFLVMTYILKARGLTSARELGHGVFSRTVMMKAVKAVPDFRDADPPTVVAGSIPPFAPPEATQAVVIPSSLQGDKPRWRLRGLTGPLTGQSFPLLGQTLLGRDPSRCAVHLEESTVSREHAAVEPDPTTAAWRVRRVSRNGYLYVNGSAVDEALLTPGDQIQMGSSIFLLEEVVA